MKFEYCIISASSPNGVTGHLPALYSIFQVLDDVATITEEKNCEPSLIIFQWYQPNTAYGRKQSDHGVAYHTAY